MNSTVKKLGYFGVHAWVRKRKPKPKLCVDCKINPPRDLANISGEYKQDINDYDYLCRSCHKKRDIGVKTRAKYSAFASKRARNEKGVFI